MQKVLNEYVLIEEPIVAEKKSASGIFLGEESVDLSKPVTGKVLKVGKNVKEVAEGDTVMYMPRQGIHMKQSDEIMWRFLKEENIIAVM